MDKKLQDTICESVEALREELIKTVSEIVQIPSVNPLFEGPLEESEYGESLVNEYMEKIMKAMGLKTDLWEEAKGRKNLVGVYKGQGEGKSLLFNGHVDVVPPGDLAQWHLPPFSGAIEDNCIWGRGSVDMKGGNAAVVFALKALLNSNLKPKGDVLIHNVVGEETKSNLLGTTACLKKGYVADAAIVPEPTCGDKPFAINPASSGIFEMKWTVKGKAVHAGLRREVIRDGGLGDAVGVDAIEKGMIIYKAIKDLEKQWGQTKSHPLYKPGKFCLNGATINAGTAPSFIPDKMEMSYAIFYPPQDSPDGIKKEIEDQITAYANTDPWLKQNPPEVKWLFNWPSFDVSVDSDICKTLQAVAKSVNSEAGEITGMFAVCDASFISEYDIPVMVMGPGKSKYAHTVGEHLDIDMLVEATKIYALLIADWCGIQ